MSTRLADQPLTTKRDRTNPLSRFGRRHGLCVVVIFAALMVAIDVWWLVADRRGYPLDIDEAGYMTIAMNDHAALVHGGFSSYWHAIDSPSPYAPLVPALTAFVYLARTSILASYAVELAFFALLAVACYGVATRLLGPRLGTLASIVALSAPGVTGFTREYLFALPSAALLMCAIYALMRSDGLRSRGWAAALGLLLALMLLARTMTIAIAPAVLLAAVVRVVTLERGRLRSAVNLSLGVALGAVIAGVWYLPSLSPVFHYLTEYGYGSRSGKYGAPHSILSWAWWSRELHTILEEDLYVPLGVAALVGLGALALSAARRLARASGRAAALLAAARGDAATLAIVLVGGYLALTSSANRGSGFALVLVPPLVVLAALPLRRAGRLVPAVAAVVGLIVAINVIAATDVWHVIAEPRRVDVPALGSTPVVDGEGNALAAIRQQLPGDPTHFNSGARAWLPASRRAASLLITYAHVHGRQPVVAFGMRNRVFNTNTVALAARLYDGMPIPMAQLDPRDGGDRASAYASYLANPQHGQPNFLVTSSSTVGDYTPVVTQARAIAAARADRFRPALAMTLPDGRKVTFWWLARGPSYDAAGAR